MTPRPPGVLALLLTLLGGAWVVAAPDAPREERTASPRTEDVGTLHVEVIGLRNEQGQVLVSLYDRAEGFPRDRDAVIASHRIGADELGGDRAEVRFEGLSPGNYAVAILHDENESGDMDTGFLGRPKEGYGFSNDVRPRFKAPSFEKARFRLVGPATTIQVRVRY